jgi:hypothetical protein
VKGAGKEPIVTTGTFIALIVFALAVVGGFAFLATYIVGPMAHARRRRREHPTERWAEPPIRK